MLRDAPTIEEAIKFAAPTEGADIGDNYASMELTLRRHPLALLRPKLAQWIVRTADDLRRRGQDKEQVRASGIVTHRSRARPAA